MFSDITPLDIVFGLGLIIVVGTMAAVALVREPKPRPASKRVRFLSEEELQIQATRPEPEVLPGSIPCLLEPEVVEAIAVTIPPRTVLKLCPKCSLGVLDGNGCCSICSETRGVA